MIPKQNSVIDCSITWYGTKWETFFYVGNCFCGNLLLVGNCILWEIVSCGNLYLIGNCFLEESFPFRQQLNVGNHLVGNDLVGKLVGNTLTWLGVSSCSYQSRLIRSLSVITSNKRLTITLGLYGSRINGSSIRPLSATFVTVVIVCLWAVQVTGECSDSS